MGTTTDERVRMTVEQMRELLDIQEDGHVHTLRQRGGGPGFALVGVDEPLEDLLRLAEKYAPELSGETATAMEHGVALWEPCSREGMVAPVYLKTKKPCGLCDGHGTVYDEDGGERPCPAHVEG